VLAFVLQMSIFQQKWCWKHHNITQQISASSNSFYDDAKTKTLVYYCVYLSSYCIFIIYCISFIICGVGSNLKHFGSSPAILGGFFRGRMRGCLFAFYLTSLKDRCNDLCVHGQDNYKIWFYNSSQVVIVCVKQFVNLL